jgi:hypothetical protein
MILKLSIVGLFIVLVVVLMITYYTQLEGFITTKSAADVLATSGDLLFICGPNTDIKDGKGNGSTYKASSDGKGNSMISLSQTSNASTMVSNCACLKFGKNIAADVMMCTPGTGTPTGATATGATATGATATGATATGATPTGATATGATPTGATASTGTALSAANPQRNDVQPQVTLSDTSYDAMALKQKSDLLSNIQKMFRNELLANRSTDSSVIDKTTSSSSTSSSTQQGNEFNKASQKCDDTSDEDSYRCPKNPDGSCPPVPDMTQYIKKDAIPCWGCSVDY